MPPVTKAGAGQFRKDVAFAETKDSDEFALEAAGIVMVPDKADLQNDFAREDTIRSFAEQFATFAEAGQAGGGIMHAVWPDGWMELERNEVLDEAAEIGGETVAAGAWVQRWGITNEALAGLVDDGILEGYSIGAIQVDWNGPFEQDADDVANVDTSEIPDDELVWELTDGIIREVSAVDIPAVPDAQILEAKADARKRLAEHVGNRDAFIEEAMERGHSEADAERLWDVLNDAVEADGSAQPGKQTIFARAGKAFLQALTGADDGGSSEDPDAVTRADVLRTFPDDAPIPDDIEEFEECTDWADDQEDIDDPEEFCGEFWEPENAAAKEGQTLSQANRESAMAAVDANLDLLRDAGVDVPKRFTDRDDVAFDLDEHQARAFDDEDEDMFPLAASRATKGEALGSFLADAVAEAVAEADEDVDEDDIVDDIASTAGMDRSTIEAIIDGDIECPPIDRLEAFAEHVPATVAEMAEAAAEDGCEYDVESSKHASGGETPGDDTSTMSDSDGEDDDKTLAEQNAEQIKELTDTVADIADAVQDKEEETVELELGGEVVEVTESEAKAWFEGDGGEGGTDPLADAPPHVKALAEQVEAVKSRLDRINQQSGTSDQIHAAAANGASDEDPLDDLAKLLS